MKTHERRTAIVTGAGHPQGIGHAIALGLANSGLNVVVCDLAESAQHLEGLAKEMVKLGVASKALAVDVTCEDQVNHVWIE